MLTTRVKHHFTVDTFTSPHFRPYWWSNKIKRCRLDNVQNIEVGCPIKFVVPISLSFPQVRTKNSIRIQRIDQFSPVIAFSGRCLPIFKLICVKMSVVCRYFYGNKSTGNWTSQNNIWNVFRVPELHKFTSWMNAASNSAGDSFKEFQWSD